MILVDKPKLKFLLAGREILIDLPADRRVWRTGRDYAAGVRHNHAICRVQIVHVRRHVDDAGADRVELTVRHAQADEPRLLGKKGGYVTNPAVALPDEPEAVDEQTQEKITRLANTRWREHTTDPHRRHRDEVARSLEAWRESLQHNPSPHVARKVLALERILASLNRDLAA